MIIWAFLAAALAAAGIYSLAAGFVFWKALLVFIGAYALSNIAYALFEFRGAIGVDKNKPVERQSELCRRGIANMASFVDAYLRVKVTVTGMEKLPKDSRFLFICNHLSMADPIVVWDKLRDYNISFIGKPSLSKLPILWRLAYGAGCLAIDRENDREALKTIITAANYLKKDICAMGIYPEGTRSKDGKMLPFRAGAFKIAQKANVPLVIASISGTDKIKRRCPLRSTRVNLNILEVIPAEKVKSLGTAELSEYAHGIMENSLKGSEEK